MKITSAQEQIIIIYFYNIIIIIIVIIILILIRIRIRIRIRISISIITSAGADGDDALGGREGHGGVSEGMEYPEYPLQYPWSYDRYIWSTLRVL